MEQKVGIGKGREGETDRSWEGGREERRDRSEVGEGGRERERLVGIGKEGEKKEGISPNGEREGWSNR